jgi:hypothetical protein
MEKKLLQRELAESSVYYAGERRKHQKLKTNVVLVVSILIIAVSLRFTKDSTNSNINESTNQQYFDIPPHQLDSNFKLSRIA